MGLRLRTKCTADFPKLVNEYKPAELASPRRSTVPLLAFWANPDSRFRELAKYTGLDPIPPVDFCFEFPVHVQHGKGKASFTDLMIISASFAVAIEAKYTEPEYETVEKWLSKPGRKNREAVLGGWLSLIQQATGVRLELAQVAKCPYQLIHRTASACSPPVQRRWVVYQVFSKSLPCYYLGHLTNMQRLLCGQSCLSFGVLLSPFDGSVEYSKICARWENGERDLSTEVRAALLSGPLSEFKDVRFVRVDENLLADGSHEEPPCDKLPVREVA
jgi:hypothetical protein